MATTPEVYVNFIPNINVGDLSPLQLALASALAAGFPNVNNSPILVNKELVDEMVRFTDSALITPLAYDYQSFTDSPFAPLVQGTITGLSYIYENGETYIIRRAQDCGPDENRQEKVKLPPSVLAQGTFAYYGSVIRGGTYATGGGGPWGTGGITSPYPRNDNSPGNPYVGGSDAVPLGSYATSNVSSFIGQPVNTQLIGNYAGQGGIT
jgi:hypothetical protein